MRRTILLALVTAALGSGCYTTGEVAYSGGVTATAVAPDLVYVSPGVQVIADYDEPIFYSDNYYWRYYGGTWYRSSWYTGGWVYASPPRAVLSIRTPHNYVRYRPHGYVARNRPVVRDHRTNRPVYRDSRPVYRDNRPVYRDNRPVYRDNRPVYRGNRPVVQDNRPVYRGNSPVVRDHRDERAARPARAPAAKDKRQERHDDPGPRVRDHRR